jgi:hypothetical protein
MIWSFYSPQLNKAGVCEITEMKCFQQANLGNILFLCSALLEKPSLLKKINFLQRLNVYMCLYLELCSLIKHTQKI